MKVLTAAEGFGTDDFAHTIAGEVVYLAPVCAIDNPDQDGPGGCGCGRAFTGLSSRQATSVAAVRDLDVTLDELAVMVRDSLIAGGWLADDELGMDAAEEIADIAVDFPVGTLLRRDIDEVSPA